MNQCDINLLNTCTKTATTSTLYDLINAKNDVKKKEENIVRLRHLIVLMSD